MYKPIDKLQHSFLDFNQPMGLKMNLENRWIKMAGLIPWDEFELKYAKLIPSDTGNIAKLLRMALGALIIQTKFQYADCELVEQITENPYLQYFIGLPSYQNEAPFDASALVLFRKRISAEMLTEAVERFKERTGSYPERVLEDQIYRTRENRKYCKEHGIRLSGPKLGRPSPNVKVDKKQENQDNTDRIEVERAFSLDKRCYGMGMITTKLEETQLTSIALSVFVSNLFRMQRQILFALLYLIRVWSIHGEQELQVCA